MHIIDITDPEDEDWEDKPRLHVHKADVRVWVELSDAFATIDVLDYVFVNAGLGALDDDLLVDHLDASGRLKEPRFLEVDTNIRGVFNTSRSNETHDPKSYTARYIPKTNHILTYRISQAGMVSHDKT